MEVYDEVLLLKKIKFIHQLGNTDCGLACLAMLFRYYNTKISLALLSAENMTGRDGLTLGDLKHIAEHYNFKFKAYRTGYNDINISNNLPVMVCSKQNHFIVVEKRTKKGYKVVDPDQGRRIISLDDLKKNYLDLIIVLEPLFSCKQVYKEPKLSINFSTKNICYIALLTLFLELFVLVVPRITSMIVDDISNKLGYEIQKYALCTVAIIFVYFIASIMRKRIILHTQLRIYHQIIKKMLTKLFGLDLSFFQSHMTGDIVNRLNSVSSINDFISNVFITFAIDFITAIVCGIAMTLMNPILFFTVICITIIQIVLISIIRRGITLDTQLYQGEQSKLQSDLVDLIANLVSIKCMGIDFQMNNKINTSYNKNIDILYRKEKKSDLLECVITTISLVTSLIIYIVGGYFVERQELSLGELVQFVSLATFFIVPFKSISVYMPQFSTIREMIERIKEVLFYKEISNDGKINLNRFEKLEMKGVYFGYAANETLLKDININVYAGNKIAIVGPSGSGKTSITKLMMNIFDTYEGHILINGVEIDKINRESYYKKLAVVTQQPLAFNDTIRKNIDPSETLDDNQIYEVLKQAELYDEIMQFPLKLNTKIGENGQNISGGQKQRIAIARALASNPSIVIFDEGTSNLDSVTEKSIFENLNEKGITQIIISHRLSTTQDADYIYVIKDGKIVESGKHDELIKKWGFIIKIIQVISKISVKKMELIKIVNIVQKSLN